MKNNNETKSTGKRKMTSRQIVAIIGIVLLVLLYLVTLIVAFVDQSQAGRLFQACLAATVAIPFLIWIYIWMYGRLRQKHTIADLDIGGKEQPLSEDKNKPVDK